MKMVYKNILMALSLLCLTATGLSAIEIKELPSKLTLSKALYNHCLELTQSQQLLKLYIQSALHLRYQSPQKTLEDAIPKYDKRLKTLQHFFNTQFTQEEDKKRFAEGVEIWENEVKPLLLSPPNKRNTVTLKKLFSTMYTLLKSTKVLAKKLTKKGFSAVKMTGGICYGSQDMATLYLMKKALALEVPDYKKKMQKKMASFEKKLAALKALKINTPEINTALDKAKKAYHYFTFMYDSEKSVIPSLMSKKADEIFHKIESVKKLYGKILKNTPAHQ